MAVAEKLGAFGFSMRVPKQTVNAVRLRLAKPISIEAMLL